MAKNDNLADYLADIADAIRAKKGTEGPINAQNFATEIASIEGGGGSTNRVLSIRRNTQGYIDTGVDGANSNLTIKVKYVVHTFPTGYWMFIGAYQNEDTNATRILFQSKSNVLASLNSKASSSISLARDPQLTEVTYTDAIYPASVVTYGLKANGTSKTASRSAGYPLTGTIKIFAVGTDVVDISIYHCEIYDGDTLIRNFIPDYRNGEYGLYDTINKKFYGNDGEGEFSGEIITLE